MGFNNNIIACLLMFITAFASAANGESVREILLQDIETLAVDKPLRYDNGEPVAVIDTGVIADTLGRVARGPHTFEFKLEETAPFAVMVRGERVEPGATLNFVENLTAVNSRLVLPIYPAELGVGGKAKFELDLPKLYIRACPVGFTEGESDCFKITYDEMIYICPTSETTYREDTEDCRGIRVTPSIPYCDTPFELSNGTCVHNFTTDAYENCPSGNGWSISGETCEFYEQQPIKSCPSGYTKNGNLCYQIVDKLERCPTGYTNTGSLCKKDESSAATPYCPSGYSRSGSTCLKTETQSATPYCPSGYSRSGSTCSKTETQSASSSCPSGYSKSGTTCSRTLSTGVTYDACSSGYSSISTTQCRRTVNATKKCPSGYKNYSSTQCSKTTNTNYIIDMHPSRTCPNGDTTLRYEPQFGGMYIVECYGPKTVYKDKVYSCSSGYSLSGSKCTRTVNKTTSCPSGYSKSGSTCKKTETRSVTYSCPSGYSLSSNTCSRTLTQTASYSCPSGYSRSGTTCSRTVSQSVNYSCSAGWSLSGSTCKRTLTDNIDYFCGAGTQELNNESCYDVDATPSAGNCPSGSSLNSRTGACETRDSTPVVYTCPTENGDKYTLQGSDCHYSDMKASNTKCHGEAALIEDGASCELHLVEEAIPSCEEEGYIPLVTEARCMRDERVPFGQ